MNGNPKRGNLSRYLILDLMTYFIKKKHRTSISCRTDQWVWVFLPSNIVFTLTINAHIYVEQNKSKTAILGLSNIFPQVPSRLNILVPRTQRFWWRIPIADNCENLSKCGSQRWLGLQKHLQNGSYGNRVAPWATVCYFCNFVPPLPTTTRQDPILEIHVSPWSGTCIYQTPQDKP